MNTEVLIVGAGPTGLVLAIWLARRGVSFRLIDKTSEPGTTSRAMAVHARTLEFYRALGFADEVVAEGRIFDETEIRVKGRRVGGVLLGRAGASISPYPFVLAYPQDEHERLLIAHLENLGARVERLTTLTAFHEDAQGVVATLAREDGSTEEVRAAYLCGCDGAHGAVRKILGTGFPGAAYEQAFFVADCEVSGPTCDGGLHACLGDADFTLVFPMKGQNRARLIGTIPKPLMTKLDDHSIDVDDLRADVRALAGLEIESTNWFSTYRIHHRVADRFRTGRAFLLGDAAHIHSPAGGQGMNTGIGDAVNLGWKLAEVLRAEGSPSILDSYEPERRAFALRLVATTDRAFQTLVDDSFFARFFRLNVFSRLIALLSRVAAFRRLMFRTISQTSIEYRSSPISVGSSGALRAGDRLPWFRDLDGSENDGMLASLDWHIQIYGDDPGDLMNIPRRVRPLTEAASRAGFRRNVIHLVRPDGHLGYVGDAAGLKAYWSTLKARS